MIPPFLCSEQGYEVNPYDSRQSFIPLPGQEIGFPQQPPPFVGK